MFQADVIDVLRDYGKVDESYGGAYVTWQPTGPMADGSRYAAVWRGSATIEVGILAADETWEGNFQVTVGHYRSGPVKVNWGAFGAQTPDVVRKFARLLNYAADIAAALDQKVAVNVR